MRFTTLMKSLCVGSFCAVAACAAQPAQSEQVVRHAPTAALSPDSDPPCANETLTQEMREVRLKKYLAARAERAKLPPPPVRPATESYPIREGALPKHNCFLEVAKRGNIDLLFVGDSITDFFGRGDRGQDIWKQYYGSRNAANFGSSGDTTQDVLWRIENGELEGFEAKVIVLMLGTNNIGRNENADIAAGDKVILDQLRDQQPQAKILLLGIFPRGEPNSNARKPVAKINAILETYADDEHIFYLDAGDALLNPDGSFIEDSMADGVHPATKGYQLWAEAMETTLAKWLGPLK